MKLYLSVFAAVDPQSWIVNRDLTTGVLKIRTKKETIKGKRDCKGTLDRLLALFSATFNQTALGLSEDTTEEGDWLIGRLSQ